MNIVPADDSEHDPQREEMGIEHLVKIKEINKQRLEGQRAASRQAYEALSPSEKAVVDANFHEIFAKISAQFGKSSRFAFKEHDSVEQTPHDQNGQDSDR